MFAVKGSEKFSRALAVPNHTVAVNVLMDWQLLNHFPSDSLRLAILRSASFILTKNS
jgi:hypothetical protein